MSPLAKKLQIKPNTRWLLFNAPAGYTDSLSPLPDNVETAFDTNGSFDGIQLFATSKAQLDEGLTVAAPLLKTDTVLWIMYPKKSSGIKSDLEMMGDWHELGNYGYQTVRAVSIDEVWTALRFKPIGQSKISEGRKDEVRKGEHSAFIDVDNKIVILPDYIKHGLEQKPDALAWFQQLSYSNKKEYVLWILTAKQDKTREERLIKMVDMLLAKKKNPGEK